MFLFFFIFEKASRVTTTSDVSLYFYKNLLIIFIQLQVGRIHLSSTSWQLIKDSCYFETSARGQIEMKVS